MASTHAADIDIAQQFTLASSFARDAGHWDRGIRALTLAKAQWTAMGRTADVARISQSIAELKKMSDSWA